METEFRRTASRSKLLSEIVRLERLLSMNRPMTDQIREAHVVAAIGERNRIVGILKFYEVSKEIIEDIVSPSCVCLEPVLSFKQGRKDECVTCGKRVL